MRAHFHSRCAVTMQNDQGKVVDIYIPRRWYVWGVCVCCHALTVIMDSSATGRVISAKDHASVQINVADVDPETGKYIHGKSVKCVFRGVHPFSLS
jgi:hypothetical protein